MARRLALFKDYFILMKLALCHEWRQLANLIAVQAREYKELGVILSIHCSNVNKWER